MKTCRCGSKLDQNENYCRECVRERVEQEKFWVNRRKKDIQSANMKSRHVRGWNPGDGGYWVGVRWE